MGINGATMRVDDRLRDRESDPEAVRLCRDEWREHRAVDLCRQARSTVAHRDFDIGSSDFGADGDATTPRWVSAIASMAFITRFTRTCCKST